MVTTVLLMVLVLAVGTQAADNLRVRQEEIILRKLPLADAHDYFQLLRRRARRVRIMRAITVAGLLLSLFAARKRFLGPTPGTAANVGTRAPAPTNTEAAQSLAEAELRRQAARGTVDPTKLELRRVSGDDRHPWIFEYRAASGGDTIRIYVDRAGATELHRIP